MMGTSHAAPPLASSASGAYDSFMTRTILQALAWLALIGIAIATLSPIGLRPRLSMLPVVIERSAAFVVVGLLFALAYPRKIWLALLIVIIGVFGLEWLQELRPDRHGRFADAMVAAGVDALYIHARKAWLQGLSPKENRTIPPLDYPRVHRLGKRLAPLPSMINGGIETLEQVDAHLEHMDGVMLGRAAYHNPMLLAEVDARIFGDDHLAPDLAGIMQAMADYAEAELTKGNKLNNIARHMLGLAVGRPGARQFRQILSVDACKPKAGPEVFTRALAVVEDRAMAEAS